MRGTLFKREYACCAKHLEESRRRAGNCIRDEYSSTHQSEGEWQALSRI